MNPDIERLKEILDNGEFYFSISYRDSAYRERILSPLKEENNNARIFQEYIEKARRYGAKDITVKCYRKANKKFKLKPEFEEKISLDKKEYELNGLELFGGLAGFINQQVGFETMKAENERLQKELEEVKEQTKSLESENKELREKNLKLSDSIRELKWYIKQLKREHKNTLEDVERKTQNFERLLTLGGTVLIKAAGIDEKTLYGLLGLEEEAKQLPQVNNNEEEISVSVNAIDKDKEPAIAIAEQINGIIKKNIEANTPQDAINYMQSLYTIIDYIHQSYENFNHLLHFIANNSVKANENVKTVEQ